MKRKMRFIPWRNQLYRLQLPYYFSNQKAKDRLFCYVFEHDRKALLQLYNALNHTDYQDEQALQIVTLDGVVYMAMNNDVAFLLVGNIRVPFVPISPCGSCSTSPRNTKDWWQK